VEQIPVPFERLERALEKRGDGPLFNGAGYALVDAAYAPFLQRYFFLDRVRKIGHIEKFPRLAAWAETLIKRPSTHSFPPDEFEALYRRNVKCRNKWVSQFIRAFRSRRNRAGKACGIACVVGARNRDPLDGHPPSCNRTTLHRLMRVIFNLRGQIIHEPLGRG
jgi:hypothetical protein